MNVATNVATTSAMFVATFIMNRPCSVWRKILFMNIYFLEICAFYTFLVCFVLRPRLNMASWLATFQRGQNNGPCYGHVAGHDEHVRNMAPTWPEHGPNMPRTWPQRGPSTLATFKRGPCVGHVCGHVERDQLFIGHVTRPCSTWPITWPEHGQNVARNPVCICTAFLSKWHVFGVSAAYITSSSISFFKNILCTQNIGSWSNYKS